jgi:hypothetical protein
MARSIRALSRAVPKVEAPAPVPPTPAGAFHCVKFLRTRIRHGVGASGSLLGLGRPVSGSPLIADAPLRCGERKVSANTELTQCSKNRLLDNLVGKCEQLIGDRQAEHLGSGRVDDKIEIGRLLHRNVARFRAARSAAAISKSRNPCRRMLRS